MWHCLKTGNQKGEKVKKKPTQYETRTIKSTKVQKNEKNQEKLEDCKA